MAAPMDVPLHHVRGEICSTRPTYREGRNPKAVKVYTINLESSYLLVQGVPALGATQELIKLFALYGAIAEYRILDDYPTADKFTDVFLIKFERIQAARIARRKLDDWSFFGGILHVCYAPEYESVEETRFKLQDRRKAIAARIRKNEAESGQPKVFNSTESQSALSGQSSNDQGQKSKNQFSTAKGPLPGNSFPNAQEINPSKEATHTDRTGARETQRLTYKTNQFDARVPPIPYKADTSPLEEEQQVWIPPPPKEGSSREDHSCNSMSDYEFARVRTAHSVFPPNYDARILTDFDTTKSCQSTYANKKSETNPAEMSNSISEANNNFRERLGKKNLSKGDNSDVRIKQKEVPSNYENDQSSISHSKVKLQAGVIVRAFKPQTAPPKFVPRQMMKLSKKTVNNSVNTLKEEVNRELRQNALKLGDVHGPVAQGQDSVQEPVKPTETEESVEKTRMQIRKRVSEITSSEESTAKKAKSS
ncbi:RNA-binding protein 48-like [Ylistrum balloti]|uniref:RNA-binding protein 48-like n=1 Tax=Ylistrum balloti TaxID=509963 RepID=UPI0029057E5B|nr:RNA-binding protein 48-like [Ylistrum balloti]